MPIQIFSFETIHHHNEGILTQMLILRNQEFKERQNYDVPVFKGMEYDQFDTPAAVYIVYLDDHGIARGCSRMSPTDRPYMIEQLWPNIITTMELPHSEHIWESSRFCIDSTLPKEERQKAKLSILQAKMEYCLEVGMEGLIGVMPPLIWRAVFSHSGWPIKHLGEILIMESGEKIVPAWIPVHKEILSAIQKKNGETRSFLPNIKAIDKVLTRQVQTYAQNVQILKVM